MSRIVHARLDADTEATLRQLRHKTGLRDSELVRRGLRLLGHMPGGRARRIIGLARFRSGVSDLGSNRSHLEGFGKK